ncbi:MAG: DUF5820 family protein [Haloarculaceae archaeon]
MAFDSLPEEWVVWASGGEKAVLAYRPDVFDTEAHPAPCLPTIYVSRGKRDRQPGRAVEPDAQWYVTLYLEPEVDRDEDAYDTREAAEAGAVDLATRFAAGDLDYRALYQVPRESYLDALDELTGRDG